MLVLSRERDEAVMVGDIKVTVVSIRGDKVRLGFEAPKKVPIHRYEVWADMKRQRGVADSLAVAAAQPKPAGGF
jgi:carbon storage regulator